MGSKAQTPSTTTTTTTPWSGVQPYLTDSLQQAQNLYQSGAGYYPTSTVAPLSSQTQQALDLTQQRALNGSPLQSAAQGNATNTLNGAYLNSNPGLQGAIDAATQGLVRNYQTATLPGIQGSFSKSGRYGSGAMQGAVSDAQNNLAGQIGNISQNLAYQNYGDERNRQVQTSALAPQLAGMDFSNLQALTGVGQTYDTQNQAQLTDLVNRYNYQNGGALDDYIARLNGTGATNFKNSASSSLNGTPASNGIAGGLGGALAGAQAGSFLGPWGTLGGGVLGGLAGAFL
ncbi:MAG: hypothetical protein J0I79_16460 [Mesorhizobium sp.]|uniref:hypothetical protein n=1 Tax=Mesorhizobium sp. TaxID=1871066 RepID=UPI001ACB4A49|nr:hypothetical protein [Mesorhizobium sp.]MBN9219539.1 hypothetical protein [Mesorhizobium sp.]